MTRYRWLRRHPAARRNDLAALATRRSALAAIGRAAGRAGGAL